MLAGCVIYLVFFLLGEAGSGKSSAMAKIALDWAGNDESADLDQCRGQPNILRKIFDFMFMVPLKTVDSDIPLERLLIQQHELEDKNITEDEIKTILHSSRCLLVFDGYDEYKKGTNAAIDAVISGKRRNSFVLVTSRPDYIDKTDRKRLNGEIQIKGLSNKSIEECINRYFDMEEKSQSEATSKEPVPATQMTSEGSESGTTDEGPSQKKLKSQDLIKKAKNRDIYGFLKIPILLLMVSVLYIETGSLPERRSDIMWEIIQIYIKRAEEKGVPIENPDKLLRHLGKLSYDASQRDTHQLMIKKVSIQVKFIHYWQRSPFRLSKHLHRHLFTILSC